MRMRVEKEVAVVSEELRGRIIAYRTAIALMRQMLEKGLVTREEYGEMDTIFAKKYEINSYSIFR